MESYATLKEALLELYLSVKIRSDEEIDNYTQEQFQREKEQMQEVDGFTLIDYVKSSIEILMNMKMEEQEEVTPGGKRKEQRKGGEVAVVRIDGRTPTSSIMELQRKLEEVSSPTTEGELSSVTGSIPVAHKEYERALRQLENECRNHIKVE